VVVAILLIGLFVISVGSLILVGWRYRPGLELPPRFPVGVEMPPAFLRWRRRLLAVRLAAWLGGTAGYFGLRATGLRLAGLVIGVAAIVAYAGSLLASITMSVVLGIHLRKARRAKLAEDSGTT
jgi:hypothetical protein